MQRCGGMGSLKRGRVAVLEQVLTRSIPGDAGRAARRPLTLSEDRLNHSDSDEDIYSLSNPLRQAYKVIMAPYCQYVSMNPIRCCSFQQVSDTLVQYHCTRTMTHSSGPLLRCLTKIYMYLEIIFPLNSTVSRLTNVQLRGDQPFPHNTFRLHICSSTVVPPRLACFFSQALLPKNTPQNLASMPFSTRRFSLSTSQGQRKKWLGASEITAFLMTCKSLVSQW